MCVCVCVCTGIVSGNEIARMRTRSTAKSTTTRGTKVLSTRDAMRFSTIDVATEVAVNSVNSSRRQYFLIICPVTTDVDRRQASNRNKRVDRPSKGRTNGVRAVEFPALGRVNNVVAAVPPTA